MLIAFSGGVYVSSQASQWVRGALHEYGNAIGYNIDFEKFELSVLKLRLEVDGIRISDQQNNEKLLTVKKSIVDLNWLDFVIKRIHLSEIHIESPVVNLNKDKKNWNWQEFITAVQKNAAKNSTKDEGKPFEFLIDEFKLSNGKIAFVDNSAKLKAELTPIDIELKKLTNRESDGSIGGLESGYSIKLGSASIPVPGSDKTVKFNHIKVFGNIDVDSKNNLKLLLNAEVDKGKIDSVTELQGASGKLSSKIKLQKISIAPVIQLLPANKPLITDSGDVTGEFTITGSYFDSISKYKALQYINKTLQHVDVKHLSTLSKIKLDFAKFYKGKKSKKIKIENNSVINYFDKSEFTEQDLQMNRLYRVLDQWVSKRSWRNSVEYSVDDTEDPIKFIIIIKK